MLNFNLSLRALRWLGFLGLGLAGATTQALASTGCAAVNGGVFNLNQAGAGGFTPAFYTDVPQSGFAVGDQLTITFGHGDGLHYNIQSGGTDLSVNFHPADGSIATMTVGNGQTSLNLHYGDHSTGTVVVTVTCTPGVTVSNDSDKARAVQIVGSRIVARGSANAISESARDAITSMLGGDAQSGRSTSRGPGPSGLGGPEREMPDGQIGTLGYGARERTAQPRGQMSIGNFRLWSDVRGTGIMDTQGNASGIVGNQINVTSGLGYQLRPGLIIGALTAYEHFDYEFRTLGGRLWGDGYTGGAYLGAKLGPQMWFNLIGTYSRISYDVGAGTASGVFDADRWMVSSTLGGRIELPIHKLFAEPSLTFMYLTETQEAWRDSLATAQAARSFDEGRISIGSKLGTKLRVQGAMLSPYIGAYADYYFGATTGMPTGVDGLGLNHDWSLRTISGISAAMDGGYTLDLGVSVGGIGDNYQTVSVKGGFNTRW